jgi:hypothetical protein
MTDPRTTEEYLEIINLLLKFSGWQDNEFLLQTKDFILANGHITTEQIAVIDDRNF